MVNRKNECGKKVRNSGAYFLANAKIPSTLDIPNEG